MAKPTIRITLGALILWAASLCWAASENSVAGSLGNLPGEPALAAPAETGTSKAPPTAEKNPAPGTSQGASTPGAAIPGTMASPASKSLLGEAFIVQNHLQVYLNRPASVSLYNARGQQIFHADSRAQMESVPLMGVNSGFLYLTVRAGQTELTKKLVYTGK